MDGTVGGGGYILLDGRSWALPIEPLWRSLKCEGLYMHEMTGGFAAHREIAKWMKHAPVTGACRDWELGVVHISTGTGTAPDPTLGYRHRIFYGSSGISGMEGLNRQR